MRLVRPGGIAPPSGGYRPPVLLLNYRRPVEWRDRRELNPVWVGHGHPCKTITLRPHGAPGRTCTSVWRLSAACSAPELQARGDHAEARRLFELSASAHHPEWRFGVTSAFPLNRRAKADGGRDRTRTGNLLHGKEMCCFYTTRPGTLWMPRRGSNPHPPVQGRRCCGYTTGPCAACTERADDAEWSEATSRVEVVGV